MPRDTLTEEQIVRAAIEVLDAEGVNGLNMRRLGAQLGFAATAMYHHVKNKDTLVELAADHVFGEIGLPDLAVLGWREAAALLARGAYDMVVRHFWLIPAMSTHLVYGPNKARYDDHCLAVYEAGGFTGQAVDQASAAVLMFVIGAAQGEVADSAWRARARRSGADEEESLRDAYAHVSAIAQRFPRLRARLESAEPDENEPDESAFEFGLHALLDGLQARIAVAPTSGG